MTESGRTQPAGLRPKGSFRSRCSGLVAALSAFAIVLIPTLIAAAPADQPIFTDFEGLSTSYGVPFEIGPSGSRVEFGGNARAANVGGAALSGTQAWVVQNAAGIGSITFLDAYATTVEFYASPGSNPFGMVIRAFDPDGGLIGSPILLDPGAGWTLVSFSGPVNRIEVTNDAAGDLVYIDDFGFSTTEGPAVPLLDLSGIVVLVCALGLAGCLIAGRRKASA